MGVPADWPIDLREMVSQHEMTLHSGVTPLLSELPQRGSISLRPNRAAALPIVQGNELVGCLIVYIGSGLPVDEQMSNFLDLLARQLSTSASMVASYEDEVQSEFGRTYRETEAHEFW
jgi:hypothetical protein